MNRTAAELLGCINKLQNTRIKPLPAGDLHSNEIGLLLYLRHSGRPKQTISDLSNAFGVTRSSITQQVNRLAELGYVQKESDAKDRRSVFVGLSIKGAGLVMKLDRHRQNNMEELVRFLGEHDAKELIRLLQRITEYHVTAKEQE